MAKRLDTSNLYTLRATSESCDHYEKLAIWEGMPTKEEILDVVVECFCSEHETEIFECESKEHAEESGCIEPFEHKGKWYGGYIYWSVH